MEVIHSHRRRPGWRSGAENVNARHGCVHRARARLVISAFHDVVNSAAESGACSGEDAMTPPLAGTLPRFGMYPLATHFAGAAALPGRAKSEAPESISHRGCCRARYHPD